MYPLPPRSLLSRTSDLQQAISPHLHDNNQYRATSYVAAIHVYSHKLFVLHCSATIQQKWRSISTHAQMKAPGTCEAWGLTHDLRFRSRGGAQESQYGLWSLAAVKRKRVAVMNMSKEKALSL